jgi:hypothetical protein
LLVSVNSGFTTFGAVIQLRDGDNHTVFDRLTNFGPMSLPVGWAMCFPTFNVTVDAPVVTVGGW